MGERQFGPYRLVRQIAVGGMAEIHLAKTKGIAGFEKYVALKMIHPNFAEDEQFIQMLVDEAKIAVQLNHGNIAQTFDLGRVGDTFYITMEYVDGADLYKILRRGSEDDTFQMPLDVCAFVAKEVASALDHAHRKRDHTGKTLGIVHRDVSPQNVLVSFAGEVKLVDFGIAKATMKARQTAVGVIKGKYYYMSPEQAWGDQIDYRSDIFSAGIVLYEMITGQMLYLEEDLHRLLEMARNADIALPSTLRKGIPPQLERIVMTALKKDRRDRYQSAGDFATDLERFLHTYSPVFTASKVAAMIRQVIGGPVEIPDPEVEHRDGPIATHTLSTEDLIMDKEELQDENSVIFRVSDLRPKTPTESATRQKQPTGGQKAPTKQPTGPVKQAQPAGPRVTRQTDLNDIVPAARSKPITAVPNIPSMPRKQPTPAAGAQRGRDANEVTRQVEPVRPSPGNTEDSGLLGLDAPRPAPASVAWRKRDSLSTTPGDADSVGDHTMISDAPGGFGGSFMDDAGEDGVEATMISVGPPAADDTSPDVENLELRDGGEIRDEDTQDRNAVADDDDDDGDGPTIQRDFRDQAKPKASVGRGSAPAALAAKIHAPAVSELRKPRASRKTPSSGIAQGNVLQALVGAKPSEPMPSPRHPVAREVSQETRNEDSGAMTLPGQPALSDQQTTLEKVSPLAPSSQRTILGQRSPLAQQQPTVPEQRSPLAHQQATVPEQRSPLQYSGYAADASGLPLETPSQGNPVQQQQPYGYPQQGYPQYPQQGYPQQPYPGQPYPGQQPGYVPPHVSPGALYPLQPYGASAPKPMSLTGQLRLFEADEIGDKYKVSGGPRWLKLAIAAVIAVSLAAAVTFFIIKTTRESTPTVGSVRVDSVPPGAEVSFDGVRLADATPMVIKSVPVGTRHDIRVELARHKVFTETVNIPNNGSQVPVKALLEPLAGKLRIVTQPDGAEIKIDGIVRGVAPTTLTGIDMASAKKLELRLRGYAPVITDLDWPSNGEININQKLMVLP